MMGQGSGTGQGMQLGQGSQLGQQGTESGQGSGLVMNLGIPGQVNFSGGAGGGGGGSGPGVLPSVTTNLGGVSGGMPMVSSASAAPPPYDTGPHMSSFGVGGGHAMPGGSSVSVPPGQYSEQGDLVSSQQQQSQAIPSGAAGGSVRPAPNLEAAR